MFRLALFLLLTPLLATPCLAQQFPISPGGELPIAAIELDKMPWTRILGIGPLEFATIVGDRAKPGLYIQLVRWPPHATLKAHSHPAFRGRSQLHSGNWVEFRSNDKIDARSESSRPKSKMFKFSAIWAFWVERGMTTTPLWKCHLRHTCATDLLCFLAIAARASFANSP